VGYPDGSYKIIDYYSLGVTLMIDENVFKILKKSFKLLT